MFEDFFGAFVLVGAGLLAAFMLVVIVVATANGAYEPIIALGVVLGIVAVIAAIAGFLVWLGRP